MKEFKYVIQDPEGIHARPAGELIKLLKTFESAVTISKGDQAVDAKRIFGVMSLAAKKGQEITMTVEGADEETAFEQIQKFLAENL